MSRNSQAMVPQLENAREMVHMTATPARDLSCPLKCFESFQNVLVEKGVQSGWKILEIGCSAGYYSQ